MLINLRRHSTLFWNFAARWSTAYMLVDLVRPALLPMPSRQAG